MTENMEHVRLGLILAMQADIVTQASLNFKAETLRVSKDLKGGSFDDIVLQIKSFIEAL